MVAAELGLYVPFMTTIPKDSHLIDLSSSQVKASSLVPTAKLDFLAAAQKAKQSS